MRGNSCAAVRSRIPANRFNRHPIRPQPTSRCIQREGIEELDRLPPVTMCGDAMRSRPEVDASTARTEAEQFWRRAFYLLSAAMAAYALVQLGSGRLAGALGDVGVTCLMISLIPQFPFVRAIVAGARRQEPEQQLLHDLDRVRTQSPWAETASAAGWLLLGASFVLRAFGVA